MIEEIAKRKKLPVEFLKELGVQNGRWYKSPALEIPYYDDMGKLISSRYRLNAESCKNNFRAKGKLHPYGLNKHGEYGLNNLIIVEGESDTWSCWYCGVPCLGIPGALNERRLSLLDVQEYPQIFVWKEPDAAGNDFPARIKGHLQVLGYVGSVKSISHSTFKDISELHCSCNSPEETKQEIDKLITQAQDIDCTWYIEKFSKGGKSITNLDEVRESPLISTIDSKKPNKPLTTKLDEWVAEFDPDKQHRTIQIFNWLIKAFSSTSKHDCVQETFREHPFVKDWINDRDDRNEDWENIVQRAYNIWSIPERQICIESARSPMTPLSAKDLGISDEFNKFIQQFEETNQLKLNPIIYGSTSHVISMEGKKILEEICGRGKSTASTAWVLFDQSNKYLIVKERRKDLFELKSMLERNGEADVGMLVGFDEGDCQADKPPKRFEAYDRKKSPCRTCPHDCYFGKSLTDRQEHMAKRVVLITHKMFMTLLDKGKVPPDRNIIIDEGLRNYEDFELSPEVEQAIEQVFPYGTPGYNKSMSHIEHLRKLLRDGGCYIDDFNCVIEDENYASQLLGFCFDKLKREYHSSKPNWWRIDNLELCMGWFNFLKSSPYRAAIKSKSSMFFRSMVKKMDVPNPVTILDGSASISRTTWEEFTIYKSLLPFPEYMNTSIHTVKQNPTKEQLLTHTPKLKDAFLHFMRMHPERKAFMTLNIKPKQEFLDLLVDIVEVTDVTLTKGSIVGSNAAKDCQFCNNFSSLFTNVTDYALGAVLHSGKSMPGNEIYKHVFGKKMPKMNRWGFENLDLQHEFVRQVVDELYQTIMRGKIRTEPSAPYDVFCLIPSQEIVVNLQAYIPGAKFYDIEGSDYLKLMDIFEQKKPKTLQSFLKLAKIQPQQELEVELCKQIFSLRK